MFDGQVYVLAFLFHFVIHCMIEAETVWLDIFCDDWKFPNNSQSPIFFILFARLSFGYRKEPRANYLRY